MLSKYLGSHLAAHGGGGGGGQGLISQHRGHGGGQGSQQLSLSQQQLESKTATAINEAEPNNVFIKNSCFWLRQFRRELTQEILGFSAQLTLSSLTLYVSILSKIEDKIRAKNPSYPNTSHRKYPQLKRYSNFLYGT